jgi:tripartite-type tricarboxylate transporter receptor subunit TctC
VGELARVLGADPSKTKYVAHSGGGEANAAILSGSVDAGSTGLSEVIDQVKAGKMRLLAVSSPVNLRIDGKKPPTVKEAGVNLEMTNWRALTAPPLTLGIPTSATAAIMLAAFQIFNLQPGRSCSRTTATSCGR